MVLLATTESEVLANIQKIGIGECFAVVFSEDFSRQISIIISADNGWAAFGLFPFSDFFRNLTSASRALALLALAKSSSRMMENPVFFPVNTGQDHVEWFLVRTVRIRLPLLYVSSNKNVFKAGKVFVSCRLQLVFCRPLQIRSVQAMLAGT